MIMKDEIKEILEDSIYCKYELHTNEKKKLLDYITNLQIIEQQYSAILSENAELENKITNLQEEIHKKEAMYDSLAVDYRLSQEENERLNKIIDVERESYDVQETIIDMQKSELLELEDYKSRNEKANWWLKEMLKQAKSDETKAIINGTLELLNGGDEE